MRYLIILLLICSPAFADEITRTRPADYKSGVDKGTIEFDSKWRNYSMHKVRIPDNSVIDGNILGACNFTQVEPDTDAIIRSGGFGRNLTFIDCNLTNLRTYPDWTIVSSNTTQADFFGVDTEDEFNIADHSVIASRSSDVPIIRVKPRSKLVNFGDLEQEFNRLTR